MLIPLKKIEECNKMVLSNNLAQSKCLINVESESVSLSVVSNSLRLHAL